jgi:hypothetical protein
MLFNSFSFLLIFLPGALLLHWAADRFRPALRLSLLVLLSIAFYGYWDWRFVPLLIGSIAVNWTIAEALASREAGRAAARAENGGCQPRARSPVRRRHIRQLAHATPVA